MKLKKQGSLLLEIAIGISVIGLISGFFLTRGMIATKSMREQKTRNNIEIVTSALASYLSTNKRLPRPSLSVDGNGFESSDVDIAVGNVPFNTLGITERNSVDGHGRPLIYIVEPKLTKNFVRIYDNPDELGDISYFCEDVVTPKIKIIHRSGTNARNMSNTRNKDIVAFVIDTADNKPLISDGFVVVKPSIYTAWMQRNFFLIHYLKNCPCNYEHAPIATMTLPGTAHTEEITVLPDPFS